MVDVTFISIVEIIKPVKLTDATLESRNIPLLYYLLDVESKG